MSNPLVTQSPYLLIREISDIHLRQNFKNLQDYFIANNQMLGFAFFEQVFTKAQTNFTLAHGLKSTPLDVLVTQCTGAGQVTFNYGLFDGTNINITTTGACRIRFYVGTYYNYTSSTQPNKTDKWSINSSASSSSGTPYTFTVSTLTPLVLTAGSTLGQWITGSVAQAISLPDATTCTIGQSFQIVNGATATCTISDAQGTSLLALLPASTSIGTATFVLTANTLKAGTWKQLFVSQGSIAKAYARYYLTTAVSTPGGSPINFDTKDFDTQNNVTTGLSWRFTATVAGYYCVSTSIFLGGAVTGAGLYKNGVLVQVLGLCSSNAAAIGSTIVYLNGATDYIYISPGGTATASVAYSYTLGQMNWVSIAQQ